MAVEQNGIHVDEQCAGLLIVMNIPPGSPTALRAQIGELVQQYAGIVYVPKAILDYIVEKIDTFLGVNFSVRRCKSS